MLLSRNTPAAAADDGTRNALTGRFHEALVAYAMSPPGFNHITFDASGAPYNLHRGLNAATMNDLTGAETFSSYALECSPFSQVPHLPLGVIAAMRHDMTTARRNGSPTYASCATANSTIPPKTPKLPCGGFATLLYGREKNGREPLCDFQPCARSSTGATALNSTAPAILHEQIRRLTNGPSFVMLNRRGAYQCAISRVCA